MSERIYFVPVVGVGTPDDSRRPKYFGDLPVGVTRWAAIDGGAFMVVTAENDDAQHAAVILNPDCLYLPYRPQELLTSAEVTAVRAGLTAAGKVNDDVSTTKSWREVLRLIIERLQPGLTGKSLRMNGVQL